jgi:hypothetical protein
MPPCPPVVGPSLSRPHHRSLRYATTKPPYAMEFGSQPAINQASHAIIPENAQSKLRPMPKDSAIITNWQNLSGMASASEMPDS